MAFPAPSLPFTSPAGDTAKPENSLVLVTSALGTKESCLLPGTMLPSPLQIPVAARNSSRVTPPHLSPWVPLPLLCFLRFASRHPVSPCPASYRRGYGWGQGGKQRCFRQAQKGSVAQPGRRLWAPCLSGPGPGAWAEGVHPQTFFHLCRKGHAVWGRGFASGLFLPAVRGL